MRWMIALVLLVGCGGVDASRDWNGNGPVADREYDDPDDWTTYTTRCGAYDSKSNCIVWVNDSHDHHDPAHWHLQISDPFWSGTHRVEVDQATYDRCYVGSNYENGRCPG